MEELIKVREALVDALNHTGLCAESYGLLLEKHVVPMLKEKE